MSARRNRNGHGLTAVHVTGALLPPDFLQTVAGLEATKQSGGDYGLSKSLVLKDEIARYWRIANDLYTAYAERRQRTDLDAKITGVDHWLVPFFRDVLGYSDISSCEPAAIEGRMYPITHHALGMAVPLLLTSRDVSLDRADPRFGDEGRRRAPYGVMQELLNADDTRLWGFMSNGVTLRLLRDNPTLTRPSYIEADLERIFEEQIYSDFAALWLTLHASRLRPLDGNLTKCILESWRAQAQETGERALEHLREGVTTALRELGNGFLQHPKNEPLRNALASGSLTSDSYFQELLRLVYRILFLFAAEERQLLHSPSTGTEQRELYRNGYSLSRLRERALRRRHYDHHSDLWQSTSIVFAGLARGAAALGLPALGGLFSQDQCSMLNAALISNDKLLDAIHALAFFRTGGVLARVNYRDMGTEELGSVYESLLELHPFVDVNKAPWLFGFIGEDTNAKSIASARRLSGSYYTPVPLVDQLIKSTLEPVITKAVTARPDNPRTALLDLKVVDPACGSGHFLLAAARRIAAEIARIEVGSDVPDETARQHALREVVQHCIYGVDRNPLAVELCKTALWIESVEPGRPLSFLDPHIRCGDSLVGILDPSVTTNGIPDDAYSPLTGDNKATCRELKRRNHQSAEAIQGSLFEQESFRTVSDSEHGIDEMPEDTLDEIAAKRAAWAAAQDDTSHQINNLRANLYVGAFFAQKTKELGELVPINEDYRRLQQGMVMRPDIDRSVHDLAQHHRFFHWNVAFPEIMQRGGFDVVLGNPPWERVKLQEQEFFAQRSPRIASARNKAERTRLIHALARPDASAHEHELYYAFEEAKREAEAASQFVRTSGRFPLTGKGDVNTYALFAETFLDLISPTGRAGLVVPTGIATDNTTKAFFEHISSRSNLVSLFDFENREGLFPAVHSAQRFTLLTLGHRSPASTFVFFATNVTQLAEPERQVSLSSEEIALFNPNTRTCPIFRSVADATLTKELYSRAPVLVNERARQNGNPWEVTFSIMFDMSNDSGLFRTSSQLQNEGAVYHEQSWVDVNGARWVPLYEAKMVDFYDHRAGSYEQRGDERGYRVLPATTLKQHQDPAYDPQPFYWVPLQTVRDRTPQDWKHSWLLGFKKVTAPTNERTFICDVVPYVGAGASLPLIFPYRAATDVACLIGNLSSLVFDYITRQKLGGINMSPFNVKQLAALPPSAYGTDAREFIIPRICELIYTSTSMRPFAEDLGLKSQPFMWDTDRRARLQAELNAYYAHLYGLTRDELRYILDPSDSRGEGYPSETFRVLKQRELREFGEYRTAQLVLSAWDRLRNEQQSLGQAQLA